MPLLRHGNGAAGGGRPRAGFFEWHGPTRTLKVSETATLGTPIFYYDAQAFQAIFTAPVERVQRYLPSPNLFPVRLSAHRAVVVVAALRYDRFALRTPEGSYVFGTPYAEVGVLLLCTRDRPAPRVLPLLELSEREALHFHGYVLTLPVTTLESRLGGRALANFPKFVADMAFEEREARRSVRLDEGGRHVLTLSVRRGGMGYVDHNALYLLTDMDGQLARTVVPVRGRAAMRLRGHPARLELGDHEVADVLRELGLSQRGVVSRDYQQMQLILPAAEKLSEPAHRVVDYGGREITRGRYTVTYEPGATVDVYAPMPEEPFTEAPAGPGSTPIVITRAGLEPEPELRI